MMPTTRTMKRAGLRFRARLATAALMLLLGSAAVAETAYISAEVEIGLHEAPSAHSAILELLPEGTAVEVLERDGEAAKVRLDDGREGWIASAYLSAQASAPEELAELRGRLPELEAALEREQAARREAEERSAAAEEELAALRERPPAEETDADEEEEEEESQIQADFQRLGDENARLEQQVAELAAELEEKQAQIEESRSVAASGAASGQDEPAMRPPGFFERSLWHWLLIAFALLFCFGFGAFIVDWLMRRRHGGYRI